jgi:hypothetical protein
MHQINDVIVQGGQIVLTNLPYVDGQHVRVVVAETDSKSKRIPITKIREMLRGSVERFEDPTEPMIPSQDWELLK